LGTITGLAVEDIRFPTSLTLAGSDALNVAPDYSATYVVLKTDRSDELEGHGLTFTIGRGNEVVVAAVYALAPFVAGVRLDAIRRDFSGFWRSLVTESQLRWLGPEKGALHLAVAAVVNAVWDVLARIERKPLWKLLVDMSPEKLVAAIDFRYISDVLPPVRALALLRDRAPGSGERQARLLAEGYPAYTTSPGWLGYSDEEVVRRSRDGVGAGWRAVKLKVGTDREANVRRARLVRDAIGPDPLLMLDANQCWERDEAIVQVRSLAPFAPYWIEEPTSPDDIAAHAAIAKEGVRIATGEHVPNRVVFKQFLQAGAIQVCQPDVCRLGGVNEALGVVLMAAAFDVPVCFHAGGVGLCEYAQQLAIFDYVRVSGSLDGRMLEYVDHLHEHFVHPVTVEDGAYRVPEAPGCSVEMWSASRDAHSYPAGTAWHERGNSDGSAVAVQTRRPG
jgi:L-fuconate dehydratase